MMEGAIVVDINWARIEALRKRVMMRDRRIETCERRSFIEFLTFRRIMIRNPCSSAYFQYEA